VQIKSSDKKLGKLDASSRNMLGGSSASAAAAQDRPCTSQADCRLLESCAPIGIAGQDMADSGEGAAKCCKKLGKLDAAMTHAKDDPSLLALMAAKANAGVAADARELSRGAPAAEAELKRGRGRQVGSKYTARTGLHDLQDKTLCQVCKDLGLAWIDQAQAIAAIHLRSGSSAKSPKTNLDGLKEDTLALICADRTLASSGNRAELIARILGRGEARICQHQRIRSMCKECGGPSICQHQRQRSKCKECGGASICQHQRQKSRCKECGGPEICQHQRIRSTCKECGGASICQHQRRRSMCKECGGASICQHQRIRSTCKECGGASICPHQRIRSRCKECGGASICQHQRRRSRCKECGGASICQHQRQRSMCKECGGASICQHQRIRSKCKECGGASICPHQRQRSICKECRGAEICPHQRRRSTCKECVGASICPHQRRRSACKECGGAEICQHQRIRSKCKECGGAEICQHQRIRSMCKECGGASICQHQRLRSACKECGGASICQHQRQRSRCKDCRVQTTGEAVDDDEAEAFEAGALALAPMHEPPQKRQKTVLTVSASLVPGDAGGSAASGTHRTLASAVGVPNSQLCIAAAAAPLPEGVSEQQRAESPVHAPRPARASVMVHASAEMDSEYFINNFIEVGRAQAHLSIAFPGTAAEMQTSEHANSVS
jgi:hypothetical protein